jgi:hypothetical protein
MKRALLATLVAAVVSTAAAAAPDYQWKFRPLFVFAKSAADPSLAEQKHILAEARSGLMERDVVVVWAVGDSVSADLGPPPRETAAAIRRRFGVEDQGFRVVLVGKDGDVKRTSSAPLSAVGLFGTIDAMPMRKQELRRPAP